MFERYEVIEQGLLVRMIVHLPKLCRKLNARLAHQGFQSAPQQMRGMRQNATLDSVQLLLHMWAGFAKSAIAVMVDLWLPIRLHYH